MDDLDRKILLELEKNSRLSNIKMGEKLRISEGTVRNRVQKLVDNEIIEKFTLELNPKEGFCAFILVSMNPNKSCRELISKIKAVPGVKKVYELAGKIDLLVKMVNSSTGEFNNAIDKLRQLDGVKETESLVVLNVN